MSKVKVFGDVIFELDIKFNQSEDLVFEAKAIVVDGKTIYIGKGDITKIDLKAFDFIMNRIEYYLKRSGGSKQLPFSVQKCIILA